ncbi:hypothetical protein BV20DRAFT_636531 [Pilatotrama ljubarskyi]|nr:hypothetical protein BV20DRAFT_636531 [Pilatotrama ljubarskyi]
MKSFIVLAALVTLGSTQSVFFGAPAPQSTFASGETFVVDVARVPNLIVSKDVSVAIGLLSCVDQAPSGTCDGVNVDDDIGTVLFAGPYTPRSSPGHGGAFQNYTVAVPEGFPAGAAALSIAHFYLLSENHPQVQVISETVIIE